MSDIVKARQIFELVLMMQNYKYGLTFDDIMEKFECSRRTAQRMKDAVAEQFFFNIEEFYLPNSRKKRFRIKKRVADDLIRFTPEEVVTVWILSRKLESQIEREILTKLFEKLKYYLPEIVETIDNNELYDFFDFSLNR